MSLQRNHEKEMIANDRIVSPFAQTAVSIQPPVKGAKFSWLIWIVLVLLFCGFTAAIVYFSLKYLNDPYRTLEVFPVGKYFDDYRPMAGAKFKAEVKVSADLGWKDGVGRLMVFTAEDDSRPFVTLIPPKLAGIFFSKGQTYQVSLEVGEGGLIYADSCEKD